VIANLENIFLQCTHSFHLLWMNIVGVTGLEFRHGIGHIEHSFTHSHRFCAHTHTKHLYGSVRWIMYINIRMFSIINRWTSIV